MTDNKSLVSICIPTYNGEQFITEALNSAISQTYSNLEIVVSDDASNDATIEIIERFKKKTQIPISIYHHIPCGIGANWNNCVQNAKGEFIKFLFQDDILLPSCVEKMVQLAETKKTIGLVYCKRNFIYDKNDCSMIKWVQTYDNLHNCWNKFQVKGGFVSGKRCLKDEFLLQVPENKFGEPTATLLRRNVFSKIGCFDENLKQNLDIEYWWRVLTNFDAGFLDNHLVSFRLHKKQATQVNNDNYINESEKLALFCYEKLFWKLHPKIKWKLFKRHSKIGYFYRLLKKAMK